MASILRGIKHVAICLLAMCFPLVSSATPPAIPDEFHFEIYSNTAAELFWLRTTNVPVQGYEITRNGVNLGLFDALRFYDNTLSPRTDYTYTITAVGFTGERSGTATVLFRTPEYENTIASLQRQVSDLEQEIALLETLLTNGYRAPVPQTGQKTSILPGDDGDFRSGIPWPDPRFTVNVEITDDLNENGLCDGNETCNGTVTDNMTGLTWLQDADCFGEQSWSDAINAANTLMGDGSSNCSLTDNSQPGDWRVPNVKEIQSLLDYGHAFPTALLPADHPFVNVQLGGVNSAPFRYWTSTSTGPTSSGAYTVSISVGWVERYALSAGAEPPAYVWPVRGGL